MTASLLHNIDVLRPLGPKLQARVASIARLAALPEGTVLARQGERGDRFYGILTGEVQLTTESSRGEITVRVAGPGESVPLAVLIGDGDLITTATAMSPLRAIEIPRLPFDRLCREQPEIGRRVYATVADILADRYRRTLGRLIDTLDAAAAAPEFSANL